MAALSRGFTVSQILEICSEAERITLEQLVCNFHMNISVNLREREKGFWYSDIFDISYQYFFISITDYPIFFIFTVFFVLFNDFLDLLTLKRWDSEILFIIFIDVPIFSTFFQRYSNTWNTISTPSPCQSIEDTT